jgi:hypothetical protein
MHSIIPGGDNDHNFVVSLEGGDPAVTVLA